MQQEIVNKNTGNANVKSIVNHFQNFQNPPTSLPDDSVYNSCKESSASMQSITSDHSNSTLPKTAFMIANLTSASSSQAPPDTFQRPPPPPAAENVEVESGANGRRSRTRKNRSEQADRSRSRSRVNDGKKPLKTIDPLQLQNGQKK